MAVTRASLRRFLLRGTAAAALALLPLAAAADDVGVAAAVNPAAQGTPPGGSVRTLTVGGPIAFQEVIATDAAGQTQLLFLDHSTLTVAPNSEVVIDEFVFDPATASGTLEMLLNSGLVRYVGGQISKEGGVIIDTAVASMGIRGGMALVDVRGGRTLAVNLFGRLTVTTKAGRKIIADDPGDYVIIGADGSAEVDEITADQLADLYLGFQGGHDARVTGDTVGAGIRSHPDVEVSADPDAATQQAAPPPPPSDQETQAEVQAAAQEAVVLGQQQAQIDSLSVPLATGLSGRFASTPLPYDTSFGSPFLDPLAQNTLGGDSADTNRGYVTSQIVDGTLRVDTDGDGTVDLILPIEEGTFEVESGTTSPLGPLTGTGQLTLHDGGSPFYVYNLVDASGTKRALVFGGTPTPDSYFQDSSFRVFSYDLERDPVFDAAIPFTPSDIAAAFADGNVTSTPFLIATPSSGTIADPAGGATRSATLWMGLALQGTGTDQQSYIQISTGALEDQGQGPVVVNGNRGSYRSGAEARDTSRIIANVSSWTDGSGKAFYGPEMDHLVLSNNLGGPDSFLGSLYEAAYDDAPGNRYGFVHTGNKGEAPAGIGSQRGDREWTLYASGVGVSNQSGSYDEIYVLTADGVTDPGSSGLTTSAGTSKLAGKLTFSGSSILGSDAPDSAVWLFGGLTGEANDRGSYIDDTYFGARETALTDGGQGFDGSVNSSNPQFGFSTYLTSGKPLLPSLQATFTDVAFCACEYLQWGFWGGQYEWGDNAGANSGRLERVHMGTFVGGELPSASEIAGLTGSASYNGHILGTVVLGSGQQYIAAGNYTQSWSFNTDSGAFRVTDFDGQDFTSGSLVAADLQGTKFATSSPGVSGTRQIHVDGAFFKGGGNPAAAVGGKFAITDSVNPGSYSAYGTVAAER